MGGWVMGDEWVRSVRVGVRVGMGGDDVDVVHRIRYKSTNLQIWVALQALQSTAFVQASQISLRLQTSARAYGTGMYDDGMSGVRWV